ncbi:hypothetical protein ACKKBG_A22625 [Auxenochlorella protothecoides x Auxenochlorella symbiontica]|uniref:COP9 signalosome complex subunit 6 n=1 Tax=Auxenochlorella protothecoides TaxID=3075 RepID=A0A1D2A100_AUXPR
MQQTSDTTVERPASTSGLQFRLHPLVLISISDQCTRARQNPSAPSTSSSDHPSRVYGCLLGEQSGRNVDISNSFELRVASHSIDLEFLQKRADQYKQVFPTLDIVGWYSSSSEGPLPEDLGPHAQISRLNETPVYLVMNPSLATQSSVLPVGLFETEVHHVDKQHSTTFVKSAFTVETSEAERVGVAQVAQLLPSGASAGSGQLSAQLSGTLSALDMLMERVRSVHSVMQRMAAGEVPFDADVARGAAALASGLPALGDLAALRQEVSGEADVLMMVLAAAVTKGSGAAAEMINRYNLAYDRTGAAGISKRLTVPPTGGATRSPSEPLITP